MRCDYDACAWPHGTVDVACISVSLRSCPRVPVPMLGSCGGGRSLSPMVGEMDFTVRTECADIKRLLSSHAFISCIPYGIAKKYLRESTPVRCCLPSTSRMNGCDTARAWHGSLSGFGAQLVRARNFLAPSWESFLIGRSRGGQNQVTPFHCSDPFKLPLSFEWGPRPHEDIGSADRDGFHTGCGEEDAQHCRRACS